MTSWTKLAAAAGALTLTLGGCGGGSLEADLATVCDLATRVCPEAGCPAHSAAAEALDAGLRAAQPSSSLGRELFVALRASAPEKIYETATRAAEYDGRVWSCPGLERYQTAGAMAAHGFAPVLKDARVKIDGRTADAAIDSLTQYVSHNEDRFAKVSRAWGLDPGNRRADVAEARELAAALDRFCDSQKLEQCGVVAQALTTLVSRCSPEGPAGHPVLMLNDGKRPLLVPEVDALINGEKALDVYAEGLAPERAEHLMEVLEALFGALLSP